MSQERILLVEDEAIARRVLHAMLTHAGYDVISVGSGEEALEELEQQRFDLLLTDLQLRKIDGVAVMAAARERDPEIEVIILTGSATIDSAIAAVRHGAHNYILKPGNPGEIEQSVAEALQQRQKRLNRSAWLRRLGHDLMHLAENNAVVPDASLPPQAVGNEKFVQVGDLSIDLQRHTVTQKGQNLQLSSGEFNLLFYLAQHYEQVISPQQLVRDVLGYECTPQEARDLIKARIWALRRKIESDPSDPCLIVSVRGVGYMLTDEGH
ncbi:MAG: response regulator transcription factor [Chloroflexales bacterium]|nr:response regulator transcription factor [Chloroflexales bacterium]